MRWKLLRRRFSVSAPRMIVRSHLPWPLRWAVAALVLGFSAAIALWAFQFGKDLAGLDRDVHAEVDRLRAEVEKLRAENQRAVSVANTAESLLRAERATQERLAASLRQLDTEAQALKADLGFFERLLPAASQGLEVRALEASPSPEGGVRYQLLVMQSGKAAPEFKGRVEVVADGTLGGKPGRWAGEGTAREVTLRQYLRLEGVLATPPGALVKSLQVRVMDLQGVERAAKSVKLSV
jgi:hypothetical protein